MEVSKELLERYHEGKCSGEEEAAVEQWLLGEETEEILELSADMKAETKADMWAEISRSIPADAGGYEPVPGKKDKPFYIRAMVAASAAIIFMGLFSWLYNSKVSRGTGLASFRNTSSLESKKLEGNEFIIAIGPQSNAVIDYHTGLLAFSGSILISPAKDTELTLQGNNEKILFKTGEVYIALKGTAGDDKPIIINERNLIDLPPVIQKQIMSHFNI